MSFLRHTSLILFLRERERERERERIKETKLTITGKIKRKTILRKGERESVDRRLDFNKTGFSRLAVARGGEEREIPRRRGADESTGKRGTGKQVFRRHY